MNSNKWLWMNGFWRQNSYLCRDNFVHNILVLLLGKIMAIYINAIVSTAWWLRKVSKLADLWWTGERTRILNARDHKPHWPVKINLFKSKLHWLPFKQIASASTGSTAKKINYEHSASIDCPGSNFLFVGIQSQLRTWWWVKFQSFADMWLYICCVLRILVEAREIVLFRRNQSKKSNIFKAYCEFDLSKTEKFKRFKKTDRFPISSTQ